MMHATEVNYAPDLGEQERVMPTWLTVNEAAERDDCPVTGETLRQMIKRGDVSETCYEVRPFGKTRHVYYIDADCLANLDYREPGQRGRGKPEL